MPLASILAPQLIRKATEIENEIGPAPSLSAGYLQAGQKTPYDPKGILPYTEPKMFDPMTPEGLVLRAMGQLQKMSPELRSFVDQWQNRMLKAKSAATLLPNAPAPAEPSAPAAKGKIVLKLEPGAPIGFDEAGQAVDSKGKKLGYLQQTGDVRTLERRPTDVSMEQRDPFAVQTLEQMYGEHLKAMENNRDEMGRPTDEFPPGYFDGMDKLHRENIKKGVKALQQIHRGRPA